MPYPNYTVQELAAINSYLQREAELARDQRNLLREINEELGGKINNVKEASKQYKTLESISRKLADDAEEMVELSEKQLEKDLAKAKVAYKELQNSAQRLATQKGIVDLTKVNLDLVENLTDEERALLKGAQQNFLIEQDTVALIEKRLSFTKNLNKSIGLTGTLLKSAEHITSKLGLSGLDEVFGDAKKAAQDQAKALGVSDEKALGLNGKIKTMATGLNALASGLAKKLTDPLVLATAQVAIFTKLLKVAKDLDQTLVDTSRTLGISKEASKELYNSYAKYAAEVGDSFLNNQMLLETQIKLNKELGTSVAYNAENLEGAARLSHFYGLSEQSSAKMVELGTEQGRNSLDILRSVSKTYTLQKAQLGGTMALSKVLDKVANVSDDIYTRFKGNPEAIAKAVMQANRLGLELDQVNKIGESLLDFESSIENELKAELLTGKAINLERARAAALSGDTAKLTTEIAKQVGSIHQFEKMNVIQRKAYAEAFGMNVQEMSSMLRKREFEAKLSEDAKKSATATLEYAAKHNLKLDDALKAQYEQKSLAEEQHEVFRNLNNMIANLTGGPMRLFVDMINSALHGVQGMIDSLNSLTGGTLGNALGAAILGAPMLLIAIKGITSLFSGGFGKGMFFQRGTYPNPMIVKTIDGGIGGEGGLADSVGDLGGKGGKRSVGSRMKRGMVGKFGAKGARTLMRLGPGLATAAVGIGADLIAGQMDEGTGKDTVSGIGTTAEYAGMGAMIGSIIPGLGTVVGGVLGGTFGAVKALFDAESSRREREERAKQQQEEQQKATNDLMRQFLDRPVQLNVGGKTILDFNTASNLYGNQQSSF
jgi:hypothetical protein